MVKDCEGDQARNGACPLYPYRMGKRPPVSIFRKYCMYCTNGDRKYVEDCPAASCPVYSYRFGKNPALTGKIRGAALIRKQHRRAVGVQF